MCAADLGRSAAGIVPAGAMMRASSFTTPARSALEARARTLCRQSEDVRQRLVGVNAALRAAPDAQRPAVLDGELEHELTLAVELFGVCEAKQWQLDVARSTLRGEDVLCTAPTGAGKTLSYVLPVLMPSSRGARKVVVVVSPLRLLMCQQRDKLNKLAEERGLAPIAHAYLGDPPRPGEKPVPDEVRGVGVPPLKGGKLTKEILEGSFSVIFVTPEKLVESSDIRAALTLLHLQHRLLSVVIDEMHCVVEWDDSFMSAYNLVGMQLALVVRIARGASEQACELARTLANARAVEAVLASRTSGGAGGDARAALLEKLAGVRAEADKLAAKLAVVPRPPPLHLTALCHLPKVGVTATATPAMIARIADSLGVPSNARLVHLPLRRAELNLRVERLDPALDPLKAQAKCIVRELLKMDRSAGLKVIVYCGTKGLTTSLCFRVAALAGQEGLNVNAATYYRGLPEEEGGEGELAKRARRFAGHISPEAVELLFATEAAGMGIDVADVRLVVHAAPPLTLSQLMQHDGQAGRDGHFAQCLLLDHPGRYAAALAMAAQSDGGLGALMEVMRYVHDTCSCRHELLLNALGDYTDQSLAGVPATRCCDNCYSSLAARVSSSVAAHDVDLTSSVRALLDALDGRDHGDSWQQPLLTNAVERLGATASLAWRWKVVIYAAWAGCLEFIVAREEYTTCVRVAADRRAHNTLLEHGVATGAPEHVMRVATSELARCDYAAIDDDE